MADTRLRFRTAALPIRVESGDLVLPEEIGSKIENMYLTDEGTLRSVWGPAPYVPPYSTGFPPYSAPLYGIHHACIGEDGSREVLLIQVGPTLKVFEGWNAGSPSCWRDLINTTGATVPIKDDLGADNKPRFPAQFQTTPGGIVIIPSGDNSRPYFYDGRTILPLGYTAAPGAPIGHGPMSMGDSKLNMPGKIGGSISAAGYARLGTVTLDSINNNKGGRVSEGSWQAAYQWMDIFGNLSPISGRSEEVRIPRSISNDTAVSISNSKYLFYWDGIEPGPEGTIARVWCRTKDLQAAGTLDLFRVPSGLVGESPWNRIAINEISLGFVGIPDNITTSFPDNVPDRVLARKVEDVVAVTPFKLYTLAFGRGWAANFVDDPGKIHPTMPGRWGTFLENEEIYPDPRGAAITGMIQVPEGLLVFTETSTFMVEVSFGGEGFQSKTLHPRIGCVAPSSISMLPDGQAVWLGKEGFYAYSKESISLISQPIHKEVLKFNSARVLQAVAAFDVPENKYRCWVPTDGSRLNNVCWEYDGTGWTRRNDVEASGVCRTQDHRSYMLACGRAAGNPGSNNLRDGVWLLDHQVQSWVPAPRTSVVQTSWMRVLRSEGRGSPMTVYIWLREASSGTLTVEVQRDWRSDVVQTTTASLYPTDDDPPFWDTAVFGGQDEDGTLYTWRTRRPYWTRVDIYAPSSEVFRLRLTNTVPWEFIALAFDEVPQTDSFRSAPK